jgi:hypothetical protein
MYILLIQYKSPPSKKNPKQNNKYKKVKEKNKKKQKQKTTTPNKIKQKQKRDKLIKYVG